MTHPCSECGRFDFPEPTTCFWCRVRVEVAPPVPLPVDPLASEKRRREKLRRARLRRQEKDNVETAQEALL